MLPLWVFKLTDSEKEWIADRAASFTNYPRISAESRRRMAQLFNAACSTLVAVNALNDDKTAHRLTATVPSLAAFPFRFDFIITDMSLECEGRITDQSTYGSWALKRSSVRPSNNRSTLKVSLKPRPR
uniref:Transposase n=1 Tax=Haemonchus contortus TaxID=6289 RepID=A0A7I4Z4B2_HAECO